MPKSPLLIVSLLVGLASCDTSSSVAPDRVGTAVSPDFGTGNGPAHPGHSFVVRSNDGIFLTSVDESQDLVVRHYNTEDIDFCGGSSPTPTAEAQLVPTPRGAIYVWRTGVIPVYVYRLSEVPPQEVSDQFCQDLADKWIYRGTHRLTNHDNNLFFELGRTNAFGWNAHGIVFDRAGTRYTYRESFQAVLTPQAPPKDPIERHVKYTLSIK